MARQLSQSFEADGYRLPDYREHAVYVLSYQVHALKVRLHLALVGEQLLAATTPETLHQAIDAAAKPADRPLVEAHLLFHGNRQHARQQVELARRSSARRFFESIDDITASLRYDDDGLIATVTIGRSEDDGGEAEEAAAPKD